MHKRSLRASFFFRRVFARATELNRRKVVFCVKLGFHLDDTLNDVRYTAMRHFNRRLGSSLTHDDIDAGGYSFHASFGLPVEEYRCLWKECLQDIYTACVPLPSASLCLRTLVDAGHDVFYLSSRPDTPWIRSMTTTWLRTHDFPFEEESVILGIEVDQRALVAKRMNLCCYVDDHPLVLERASVLRIPYAIKDQAYNRHLVGPRITDWGTWNP